MGAYEQLNLTAMVFVQIKEYKEHSSIFAASFSHELCSDC